MNDPTENKEEGIEIVEEASPEIVEGELVDGASETALSGVAEVESPQGYGTNRTLAIHLLLPAIFLATALLGGMRVAANTGEFVFLGPPLICLFLGAMMGALFIRTGLIHPAGWFDESFPVLKNVANASVLIAFYAATVQILNSLIPEQGLPFWVVTFCFIWTLTVSFFSVPDARRLVRSTIALFVVAFLAKYFLLTNLTSESSGSWLQRMWDDPTREAVTYLLDLQRFSPATGYIQFFAVALFILGLYLIPASTRSE